MSSHLCEDPELAKLLCADGTLDSGSFPLGEEKLQMGTTLG
jgi:hypothetical protein